VFIKQEIHSSILFLFELKFEYTEKFSPANQYFFVNGHLAHENFTMKELDVHPDLLFVLFVIDQ
jgi:hypothetical protein